MGDLPGLQGSVRRGWAAAQTLLWGGALLNDSEAFLVSWQ